MPFSEYHALLDPEVAKLQTGSGAFVTSKGARLYHSPAHVAPLTNGVRIESERPALVEIPTTSLARSSAAGGGNQQAGQGQGGPVGCGIAAPVVAPHDRLHRGVRFQRRPVHTQGLAANEPRAVQHAQYPGEYRLVCFQVEQPPGPRNRRVVRCWLARRYPEKLARRLGETKGDFHVEEPCSGPCIGGALGVADGMVAGRVGRIDLARPGLRSASAPMGAGPLG